MNSHTITASNGLAGRMFSSLRPKLPALLTLLALLLVFAVAPAFAQDATSTIKAKTSTVYNMVYTFVYGVMGIALLACFLGAMFGRMEWSRFAQVCGAITGCGLITVLIQTFS